MPQTQMISSESIVEETFESIVKSKFLTESKFSEDIEKIVKRNPDYNYITAIVEYCEINSIDIETVSKIISKPLKEKLRYDAMKLNFLHKTTRAPKLQF